MCGDRDLFFVKQKTAYEVRISDWSSDVCSSDLPPFANPTCKRSVALWITPPIASGIRNWCCRADAIQASAWAQWPNAARDVARAQKHYTKVSVTSILPRVAFEYGQTICALSNSALTWSRATPGNETIRPEASHGGKEWGRTGRDGW